MCNNILIVMVGILTVSSWDRLIIKSVWLVITWWETDFVNKNRMRSPIEHKENINVNNVVSGTIKQYTNSSLTLQNDKQAWRVNRFQFTCMGIKWLKRLWSHHSIQHVVWTLGLPPPRNKIGRNKRPVGVSTSGNHRHHGNQATRDTTSFKHLRSTRIPVICPQL